MHHSNIKKKLIVIADDFTGANDVGVQFRKAGLKVNVIISTERLKQDLESTDVLVIDLESRFDSKGVAYQKFYDLGKRLFDIGNTIVYKKIDSTLRGNIGTEIDALMDSMQLKTTLMMPALPSSGRTTINGEVYVHNVKLADTEFAKDPRTPISRSRIADVIGMQSGRKTIEIAVDHFRDDYSGLSFQIENTDDNKILIFDAVVESDLQQIAKLVEDVSEQAILIVGTAGLAGHISNTSYKKNSPVFVFAGSVSEQTRKQINYAEGAGSARVFLVSAEQLLHNEFDSENLIKEIVSELKKNTNRFIFTTALTREDVEKAFVVAKGKGWSNEEAAEKVALAIGNLAALLINRFMPSGVLLTGGDTAIKTVKALQGTGFSIDKEIVPGISAGVLTGSEIVTMIATKSGGFGAEDAILKTIEFFEP